MTLKRIANKHENYNEDENFESLVDLFTLISISLILATVVYGLKSNIILNTVNTPIKEIVDQAGSSDISLDNLLIIYITKEGQHSRIILNDSERGRRSSVVTRESIENILESESSYISSVNEIALILDINGSDEAHAIFADTQYWMKKIGVDDKLTIGFSQQ